MTPTTRTIPHQHGSTTLEGVLITDDSIAEPAPTVMICHGMEGRSDILVEVGKRLLPWGYQAFAMDLYGEDVFDKPDKAAAYMQGFLDDRAALAERLSTVVGAVASLPEVDSARMAAFGFCFGGLCMLDLARIGAPLTGVASFHGVLTPPPGSMPRPIDCRIAVYHGWEDPFAKPDDVVALAAELTESGADWQLHAYGHAMHSFMAPMANDPDAGIQYHQRSAGRAWSHLQSFLEECLDQ